jgi:hypothetical protein
MVSGADVWLPWEDFSAVCYLIVALIRSETGLIAVSPVTIHRLRREINLATKQIGLGEALVHVGCDGEYRLAISISEIAWTKSFRELSARRFLEGDVVDIICKACREVKSF